MCCAVREHRKQDYTDYRERSEIRAASYSVEATELIAGHGDHDGDELPVHSWVLQQL